MHEILALAGVSGRQPGGARNVNAQTRGQLGERERLLVGARLVARLARHVRQLLGGYVVAQQLAEAERVHRRHCGQRQRDAVELVVTDDGLGAGQMEYVNRRLINGHKAKIKFTL